jgi:hypothetical protein
MSTRMSWPLLLPCALAACHRLDDDDHLLQATHGLLGLYADASDACVGCLQDACSEHARECVNDPGCKKAVQCQREENPGDYWDCLSELFEMDASSPSDPNGAWEGNKGEFGSCAERNCKVDCERDRSDWLCIGWNGTTQYKDYTLVLAVEVMRPGEPGFSVASHVSVQTCSPLQPCGGDDQTNDAGTVSVQVKTGGAEGLYFKLEPGDSGLAFPPTYYYPTHLGSSARQPISVYLFATETIASAHAMLGLDAGVLPDAAQALILPDGCREQSQPSATQVTVHLEEMDAPLRQCRGAVIQRGGLKDGPCIWYGSESGAPMTSTTPDEYSHGRGAAILGLESRSYVLRVCDQDSKHLRARREVVMEAGSLTVARTWPLTEQERDAGDSCFLSSAPAP